jgi:hypothetical protein
VWRVSRAASVLVGAAVAMAQGSCGPARSDGAGLHGQQADASSDAGPTPDSDDPRSCQGCHGAHYQDWSLGMHAYAADDPIFVAMNARGQRETGGALGDFCVRCHAPLAVAQGATTDGLNLPQLPPKLRGVTCVVCHTGGVADASLAVGNDGVMRGPFADPMPTAAHASSYSPFHDRERLESASLCGVCHAVTNLHGVEIERTIDEWRSTSYAQPATLRTCGRCHMPETLSVAADVAGAPLRRVHGHAMPGVDLGAALPAQAKLVRQTLDPAISLRLCVIPGAAGLVVGVTLDNRLVGHAWPSGATNDRRAWLELVATAGGVTVYSSGVVADGEAVTSSASPPLPLLRTQLSDDRAQPTLFMWNAHAVQSALLAPATADPAASTRTTTVQMDARVDRVTARVRVRAIDHDVADALVASGDLSPAVAAALPTLTVGATTMEWTADRGAACLP